MVKFKKCNHNSDNETVIEKSRIEEIQGKLNKISFAGCDDVLMGDTLYYWCFCRMKKHFSFRNVLSILKDMLKCLVVSKYSIEKKGNCEAIVLFSNSVRGRYDHLVSLQKIVGLLNNYIFFAPKEYSVSCFNFKAFFLLPVWFWQIRKIHEHIFEKLFLVWGVLFCYVDYCSVVKVVKKQKIATKYLLTLCDVMEVDSFITQKLNSKGIKTITLQHGFLSDWAICGSKSIYLLCHGKNTIDKGERLGVEASKMIPVGPIVAVGKDPVVGLKKIDSVKKVGVFLTQDSLYDKNIELLDILIDVSKEFNWEAYARFHPTSDGRLYDRYNLKNMATSDSYEFSRHMDMVIIVGFSTSIADSMCAGTPILVYSEQMDKDMDIDYMLFCSKEELKERVSFVSSEAYRFQYNISQKRMVTGGNVSENYFDAFKKIGLAI